MKGRRMAMLLALCLAAPLAGAWAVDDNTQAQNLGKEFNVSPAQLEDVHTNQSLSWDEIRTSLMISQHSGASLDEVVRMKKSGMSFDDIASRYNLKLSDIEKEHTAPPSQGTQAAPSGSSTVPDKTYREAPSSRRVNRKAQKLSDEFNVPADEVMRLHDRGLSWKEVRHALFISEQSGRPVNEIVGLKESGMSWDDIAARYNVNLKDEGKRPKEKKETMREAPRQTETPNKSDTPSGSQPGGNQEGAPGIQGEPPASPPPSETAPTAPEGGQATPHETY